MIRDQRRESLEPEMGKLGEHFALVRDAVGHDAIERGDPIRGDEQQGVPEVENLADLAALELLDAGKVQSEQRFICHGKRMDLRQRFSNHKTRAGSRTACLIFCRLQV
jgi:hypothetical protein